MVKEDNHIIESLEVSRADGGRWRALTKIRGVGVSVKDEPFLVFSSHDWEVIDYGGSLPRIAKMTVKLTQATT